jgi:hypothetical protein
VYLFLYALGYLLIASSDFENRPLQVWIAHGFRCIARLVGLLL